MSDYKPTFQVSADKRPLLMRLTPVAWVLIATALLLVGLVIAVTFASCNGHATAEPWQPTPTATTPPTPTEVLPTPTPTVWYEEMITPTPVVTQSAQLPWWADQMTEDEYGRWWPPEGVAEMVPECIEEWNQAYYAYLTEITPPDLDGYEAVIPNFLIGQELEADKRYLDSILSGLADISWAEWGEDACLYQTQVWSEDGLECTLSISCSNGIKYTRNITGELTSSEVLTQSGVTLLRMRYDTSDERWKVSQFLEWIQPDE